MPTEPRHPQLPTDRLQLLVQQVGVAVGRAVARLENQAVVGLDLCFPRIRIKRTWSASGRGMVRLLALASPAGFELEALSAASEPRAQILSAAKDGSQLAEREDSNPRYRREADGET